MSEFLRRFIRFQREQAVLFYFVLIALLALGVSITLQGEIEAFPELTNVQVQLITLYPGKAAEEVERKVTAPLEVATTGLRGLLNQRSISLFGLSVVTLTFEDRVSSRQARADVAQRLADADMPEGVKPSLAPDSTPLGEIFRYTLKGDLPVDELRLIEDWRLEREFKSIPGVADVVSFGGPVRTIEVKVDLGKLKTFGLTISSVAQALGQNHANAGGSIIRHGDESYIVRSIGLYETPQSLEQAVIATQKNVPIRIRDIGEVRLAHQARLGQVSINDDEDVVEGIILLRQGADTLETCRQIRDKIAKLRESVLPKGVQIVPYYDRTELLERSAHTVFHNILTGIALVCGILIFGLGFRHWPLTLGVAAVIPFALMVAFLGLRCFGYTPNLISLGAVDFGIIVETAIFGAEAISAALARKRTIGPRLLSGGAPKTHAYARGLPEAASHAAAFGSSQAASSDFKIDAFASVMRPALFCSLLLLIAFVPILSLQRVEGRIFIPLGVTLISALIGGQLGALIFIPLASRWVSDHPVVHKSLNDRLFERVGEFCERIARCVAGIPYLPLICGCAFAVLLFALTATLGREFLPEFNEGALWIRASAPQTISREAAVELGSRIRQNLRRIPEVGDLISQVGRPDDGTDPSGFDNIETYVALKHPDEWKSAKSIDGFVELAQQALRGIAGVDFNFSQPIKDNVDEAISGVKGELVVKIFGPKLEDLQSIADQITAILKTIRGAEDIGSEALLGQPELRFTMNRDLLASYGLRVTDAEEALESALMGRTAAKMLDEQGREISIVVKPALREPVDSEGLSSVPVLTPDGARIPLGDVATPQLVGGVNRIYREQSERRIAVKCSVRDRAVVDFVAEATRLIAEKVKLPEHYRTEWSGSFANAERASQRLMVVIPICLIAMIVILYTWFKSWTAVGLVLWEVPFSLVGGCGALRLMGLHLSISAAAGAIVLTGVSLLCGLMLIEEWLTSSDPFQALRAKTKSLLLSSGVAVIGLIPATLSTGIGSETAKPFAAMILGGLITSLVFSLTLLPALMTRFRQDQAKNARLTNS